MRFKSLLREPLLHFTLAGAALFLIFQIKDDGASAPNQPIVITTGQIEHLAAQFAKTWQRTPTESELKGLIDESLREELAVREALEAGLDRDDTIIRRRLRQKLEFLLEDAVQAKAPTEQELQAWLEQHPEDFRVEPKIQLRQVYLDLNTRGADISTDASTLLAQLQAQGPDATIEGLGDSLLLPQEIPLQSSHEIARTFGQEFAQQVADLEPGTWIGPITSGYGVHLVLISQHIEGAVATLDQVRPLVEREFTAYRSKQQLAAMYERLLQKYTVITEAQQVPPPPSKGASDS